MEVRRAAVRALPRCAEPGDANALEALQLSRQLRGCAGTCRRPRAVEA